MSPSAGCAGLSWERVRVSVRVVSGWALLLALATLIGCAGASGPRVEPNGKPAPTASAVSRPTPPEPSADARSLLVTIDDLPMIPGVRDPGERRAVTRAMLQVLARYRIRAVGFVTWSRLAAPEETALLEAWLDAGHELGNHTYSHPSYTDTPTEAFVADAERNREKLLELVQPRGKAVRFFRFPFLREGNTADKLQDGRAYLRRTGQQNLVPSLDTQDWAFEAPFVAAKEDDAARRLIGTRYQASLRSDIEAQEELGDRLTERRPAQVLLLHASSVSAVEWPALFDWLLASGHRFAGSDEVLADPVFGEQPAYVGAFGPGLFDRMAALRRREKLNTELRALLSEQAAAWSRGDLEAFCSVYAEDAVFVSPSGVVQGRDAVLARYRKRYGNAKETMGELTLEVRELRLADGPEFTRTGAARPTRIHGASIVARWQLRWPGKPTKSGHTLIVFRRSADGWKIVQDASM